MNRLVLSSKPLVLLTAFIFLISCSGPGSSSALLKFDLQSGKEYDCQLTWHTDQEIAGQNSRVNIDANYKIAVTGEDKDIKTLRVTYSRFDMLMNVMGMEIKANTDNPQPVISSIEKENDIEGIMSRLYGHIAGKSFTMKVNAEGEVLEVSGFTDIITSMVDSINTADYIKQQMIVSLSDQFNEQEAKDAFTRVFTIFPNKEVKPGETWTKTYVTGGRTPAKHTVTYTLRELKGGQAIIDMKSALDKATNLTVKGNESGELFVAKASGLVTNGAITQEMQAITDELTVNIKATGTIRAKEVTSN